MKQHQNIPTGFVDISESPQPPAEPEKLPGRTCKVSGIVL